MSCRHSQNCIQKRWAYCRSVWDHKLEMAIRIAEVERCRQVVDKVSQQCSLFFLFKRPDWGLQVYS